LKVAAVVLAAGASRRLGQAKQLVQLNGERLLERAVRVAVEAGCDPVVVVLGAAAEDVRAACSLGRATIVFNESWTEGMASSIRAGVAAASNEVDGIVLMTCDQPAVTADHLRRLICPVGENSAADETMASIYIGQIGVPAFFPVSRWGELLALRGESGARSLLKGARAVELAGGELDVDTPESLDAARERFE
jgi:CTP:molybdopterin cytidylyltransferase MocA